MKIETVYENLCWYDERSPYFIKDAEFPMSPRENGCGCDHCFYGRDKLAMHIIRCHELLTEQLKLRHGDSIPAGWDARAREAMN